MFPTALPTMIDPGMIPVCDRGPLAMMLLTTSTFFQLFLLLSEGVMKVFKAAAAARLGRPKGDDVDLADGKADAAFARHYVDNYLLPRAFGALIAYRFGHVVGRQYVAVRWQALGRGRCHLKHAIQVHRGLAHGDASHQDLIFTPFRAPDMRHELLLEFCLSSTIHEVRAHEGFRDLITEDVARAIDGNEEKIRIWCVDAGSGAVHVKLKLLRGVCGDADLLRVAGGLIAQLDDDDSPLMLGRVTCRTCRIVLMAERDEDVNDELGPVRDYYRCFLGNFKHNPELEGQEVFVSGRAVDGTFQVQASGSDSLHLRSVHLLLANSARWDGLLYPTIRKLIHSLDMPEPSGFPGRQSGAFLQASVGVSSTVTSIDARKDRQDSVSADLVFAEAQPVTDQHEGGHDAFLGLQFVSRLTDFGARITRCVPCVLLVCCLCSAVSPADGRPSRPPLFTPLPREGSSVLTRRVSTQGFFPLQQGACDFFLKNSRISVISVFDARTRKRPTHRKCQFLALKERATDERTSASKASQIRRPSSIQTDDTLL